MKSPQFILHAVLQRSEADVEVARLGSRCLSRLDRRGDVRLMMGGQLVDDLLQLGAPLGVDLPAIDLRRRQRALLGSSLQFGARRFAVAEPLLQLLHPDAEAAGIGSRRLSRLDGRSDIGLMM